MNDSLRVRGIQRIRDLEQAMNRVGRPWHFNTAVQGSWQFRAIGTVQIYLTQGQCRVPSGGR